MRRGTAGFPGQPIRLGRFTYLRRRVRSATGRLGRKVERVVLQRRIETTRMRGDGERHVVEGVSAEAQATARADLTTTVQYSITIEWHLVTEMLKMTCKNSLTTRLLELCNYLAGRHIRRNPISS